MLASDLLSLRTEVSLFGSFAASSLLELFSPASTRSSGDFFLGDLVGSSPPGSAPGVLGLVGTLRSLFSCSSFPRSQGLASPSSSRVPLALLRLLSASWFKSLPGIGGLTASGSRETSFFSAGWLVLGDSWGAQTRSERKIQGYRRSLARCYKMELPFLDSHGPALKF